MTDRELAEAIARDLFTNGFRERATRLVLTDDENGKPLGGWCEKAVADRVEEFLKRERGK